MRNFAPQKKKQETSHGYAGPKMDAISPNDLILVHKTLSEAHHREKFAPENRGPATYR